MSLIHYENLFPIEYGAIFSIRHIGGVVALVELLYLTYQVGLFLLFFACTRSVFLEGADQIHDFCKKIRALNIKTAQHLDGTHTHRLSFLQ